MNSREKIYDSWRCSEKDSLVRFTCVKPLIWPDTWTMIISLIDLSHDQSLWPLKYSVYWQMIGQGRLSSLCSWISTFIVSTFTVSIWHWTYMVHTGLKSTWIYRTSWKVLEIKYALKSTWKTLKTLKSPWILPFTGGFNNVFGDLNQYKIVVPLFGAAYAALNKGTTILY